MGDPTMTDDEQAERLAQFALMVTGAPEYGVLIATIQRNITHRWSISSTIEQREMEYAKWLALAELNAVLVKWKDDKMLREHFADQAPTT